MSTTAATGRETGPPSRGPAAARGTVQIRLLGEFAALVGPAPAAGGRPGGLVAVPDTAWRRRRAMSLVKLLALAPARRLHREVVLDALWPRLSLAEAVPRLHQCAHYARRALGGGDAVVLRGSVVVLCPEWDVTVDAEVFRRAGAVALAGLAGPAPARAAGAALPGGPPSLPPVPGEAGGPDLWAGSPSGRVVSLDRWVDRELAARAADAYRGPLLPEDVAEPWTEPHREQLRQLYLRMLRAAGRWERLLLEDPADERAHLAIMRRHAARGEWVEALHQFDRLAAVLRRELGVAPCEDALTLRAAVLGLSA